MAMQGKAFRDRPMGADELEALRLVLSSFRDGSGQNVLKSDGRVMPGFRDYERALAAVLHASTPENKGVFDVVVPDEPQPFGISCKMSRTQPAPKQSSFMELSNSAAAFRNHLLNLQINWATEPTLAGPALIDLVESWYLLLGSEIDMAGSKFAVLAHNAKWTRFQLLCFPLNLKLANPKGEVDWLTEGAALNGYIDDQGRRHRLWQVYMNSGGQMKYYPLLRWADWVTDEFELEEPPVGSLLQRAQDYFPSLWPPSLTAGS